MSKSTEVSPGHTTTVVEAINRLVPRSTWPAEPRGWRGEAEAALIDAVFSARASYGKTEETGVRGVVGRWRRHRTSHGGTRIDDLRALAGFSERPNDLVELLGNRQTVPARDGHTKAEAVALAALALSDAGLASSSEIIDPSRRVDVQRAYLSVRGLGPVTFTYFLMLLGVPGIKADTWVQRFVDEQLGDGRAHSSEYCAALVSTAADRLDVSWIHLDHAIWTYQRDRAVE